MLRSHPVLASTALLFWSCATTPPTKPEAPVPAAPAPVSAAPAAPVPAPPALPPPRTCDMFAKSGALRRASLVRLIDAGLARWLQGVEGDRKLSKHRFQGWVVKSLHPDDPCYKEVDLRAGDVVQKVNGKPIEKPEQAFEVLQVLRTAPEIVVEYLRDDKPQRLSIPVSDE